LITHPAAGNYRHHQLGPAKTTVFHWSENT
jgi:hypothetical protein